MSQARAVLAKAMTEQQLLEAVTDALTQRKWVWVHYRRSDRAQMMGMPGFPDVVAARKGRVLYLELKAQRGRLSPGQVEWSQALFPHWAVIRPADLDWLLEKLA